MKRRNLATLFAAILLAVFSTGAMAATGAEEDTDTRFVDAKVTEVNDTHISVMARTGVEHVIAIGSADTKVKIEGKLVSLKDVREGDTVTVELDEQNPLKFARSIDIAAPADSQLAKARP